MITTCVKRQQRRNVARLWMALAGLSLPLSPVVAQTSAAATDASQPERKVCRLQAETGTRMGRRVCHTKSEWADLAAQAELNKTVSPQYGSMGTDYGRRQ